MDEEEEEEAGARATTGEVSTSNKTKTTPAPRIAATTQEGEPTKEPGAIEAGPRADHRVSWLYVRSYVASLLLYTAEDTFEASYLYLICPQ